MSFAGPGHFYSAIPSPDDVARAKARMSNPPASLPGVAIDDDRLCDEFRSRAALVRDWQPSARYTPSNDQFGIGDALMLRGTLLHLRPERVIEVGSGWSSACILDARDDGAEPFELTCIDPFPMALRQRLLPGDEDGVNIIGSVVQDVPTSVFESLHAGDVLFIDSSHVLKPGSDVDDYLRRLLPALAVGVHVHIHDIFWPFEVPALWLDEGRAWNEAHALRAFLQNNHDWEIVLFNHFLGQHHRDVVEEALPTALVNIGGSIWLQRVR